LRIFLALAACLVGALMSIGEFAYVKYWAGETVAEVVLFDDRKPQTYQIDVRENDLPIRLNLNMWGSRETIDIAFYSLVTIDVGGQENCDALKFEAVIDEDGDLSSPSLGTGNWILRPGEVPNKVQSSKLLNCMSAGKWALSASVSEENGFSMQKIQATVKRNSRSISWSIAGPGLAIMLVGFIILVNELRRRNPHWSS